MPKIKDILIELNSLNEALKKSYKELNYSNEEIKRLRQEIILEEKEKQCINCHKYFHPKLNTNTSCSYHPRTVKYYSCK